MQKEIEGALWAWETLGGIGARTRRGFGAIQLQEVDLIDCEQLGESMPDILRELPVATVPDVREWLTKKFEYFGIEKKALPGVPSLSKNMLKQHLYVLPGPSNPKDVWKKLVSRFRTFRQPGKDQKKWLDTTEIKRLRDTADPSVEQIYTFPKASLGLPIVFHFAAEGKNADLTLQGAEQGHDRLASSLILRPLACSGETAIGLVLLLENYSLPPGTLQVVTTKQKAIPATIKTKATEEQASDTALNGETDVWEALMKHMKRSKKNRKEGGNQ